MRKFYLMLIALALMVVQAQKLHAESFDYPYLTFVTSGGETSVSATSLQMTISGETLTVSNSEATKTFALADLCKMYFSTTAAGIDNVAAADNEEVEVIGISGISMGKYASKVAAVKALSTGVYLLKTKSETIKIAVQ